MGIYVATQTAVIYCWHLSKWKTERKNSQVYFPNFVLQIKRQLVTWFCGPFVLQYKRLSSTVGIPLSGKLKERIAKFTSPTLYCKLKGSW